MLCSAAICGGQFVVTPVNSVVDAKTSHNFMCCVVDGADKVSWSVTVFGDVDDKPAVKTTLATDCVLATGVPADHYGVVKLSDSCCRLNISVVEMADAGFYDCSRPATAESAVTDAGAHLAVIGRRDRENTPACYM